MCWNADPIQILPHRDAHMHITQKWHSSFLQQGAGNKLDEANYGTECCCTYPTQPARKSHWSCRNIHSHTQTCQYTRKHALTHMHRSFHGIAQCLHYKVRRSHVFAGTQGPVTHRRYIYMAALFALCVCVCVEGSASNACRRIPLFVCASVWIGVYLSGINHTRVSPDSHITGIGFLLVPFPITE